MAIPASFMSALFNVGSAAFNASMQQEQNDWNAHLAQRQNAWNRENWYNAMGYNSPINQVERLKAAGLNPALMYGNGIENVAPTAPDMVSSQGVAPNIGSPFANFARDMQNEQLVESQVKLNESAANRNNAQAGLYTTQTDIAGVRFRIISKNGEELSDLQKQTMKQGIENLKAQYDNISADTAVKILQGEELRKKIDEILPAELQKIQSEIGLNEAQTKEVLELLPTKMLLNKAMASNYFAQGRLANANAEFQEKLNKSDLYVQEFINSIRLNNEGKIIGMDIELGENRSAAAVGSSLSKHYEGDYANVSRPASNSDQFINGAGTLFGTLGKLFSLIGKF